MRKLRQKYELLQKLGSGGQGEVFMARSLRTNELVACKSVPATTEAAREQACTEIGFMWRVSSCKGVVKLREVIEEPTDFHLIMELCSCSMADHLDQVGALSEVDAASYFKQVASAVGEMHDREILHLDLKCDNIFLTSDTPYGVKVGDIGYAAYCEKGTTRDLDETPGTMRFMSPEAIRGVYSTASDVWGLGLILYQCLSGKLPFQGMSSSEVYRRLKYSADAAASLDFSRVSMPARKFILEMLRVDPNKRITVEQIVNHSWLSQKQKRKRDGEEDEKQPLKIPKLELDLDLRLGQPSY